MRWDSRSAEALHLIRAEQPKALVVTAAFACIIACDPASRYPESAQRDRSGSRRPRPGIELSLIVNLGATVSGVASRVCKGALVDLTSVDQLAFRSFSAAPLRPGKHARACPLTNFPHATKSASLRARPSLSLASSSRRVAPCRCREAAFSQRISRRVCLPLRKVFLSSMTALKAMSSLASHVRAKPSTTSHKSTATRSFHKGWGVSSTSSHSSSTASNRDLSPPTHSTQDEFTSLSPSPSPAFSSAAALVPELPTIMPVESPASTTFVARSTYSPDVANLLAPRSSLVRIVRFMPGWRELTCCYLALVTALPAMLRAACNVACTSRARTAQVHVTPLMASPDPSYHAHVRDVDIVDVDLLADAEYSFSPPRSRISAASPAASAGHVISPPSYAPLDSASSFGNLARPYSGLASSTPSHASMSGRTLGTPFPLTPFPASVSVSDPSSVCEDDLLSTTPPRSERRTGPHATHAADALSIAKHSPKQRAGSARRPPVSDSLSPRSTASSAPRPVRTSTVNARSRSISPPASTPSLSRYIKPGSGPTPSLIPRPRSRSPPSATSAVRATLGHAKVVPAPPQRQRPTPAPPRPTLRVNIPVRPARAPGSAPTLKFPAPAILQMTSPPAQFQPRHADPPAPPPGAPLLGIDSQTSRVFDALCQCMGELVDTGYVSPSSLLRKSGQSG